MMIKMMTRMITIIVASLASLKAVTATQVFRRILGLSLQRGGQGVRKIGEKVCPKLGLCKDVSSQHLEEFWHPDMCLMAGCSESGDHCRFWRHKLACPDPNCKVMFGPEDERHRDHCQVYKHKSCCRLENCRDTAHAPTCGQVWCAMPLQRPHTSRWLFLFAHCPIMVRGNFLQQVARRKPFDVFRACLQASMP